MFSSTWIHWCEFVLAFLRKGICALTAMCFPQNSRPLSIDKPQTTCFDDTIDPPSEVGDVYEPSTEDNVSLVPRVFSDFHTDLAWKELLRQLQRDRRNIILDSLHPDVTPHIVISPPDQPYHGYWAYVFNNVDAQSYCSLAVPPTRYGGGTVTMWPPTEDAHYSWHIKQYGRHSYCTDEYNRPEVGRPQECHQPFNTSQFLESVRTPQIA